jgi:DNA-binding MarR family transcriptional regulator
MKFAFDQDAARIGSPHEVEFIRPHDGLVTLIYCVHNHLADAMDKALAQDPLAGAYELSSAQLSILSALETRKAEKATDLCKALAYDRSAMSRTLDRLESKALIRRLRRDGERRTITLELTAEGRLVVEQARACALDVLRHFLREIPQSEIRHLEVILQWILKS